MNTWLNWAPHGSEPRGMEDGYKTKGGNRLLVICGKKKYVWNSGDS